MKASSLITLPQVESQDKGSFKTALNYRNSSKLFAYFGECSNQYCLTQKRRKVYSRHIITDTELATTLLDYMRVENAERCFVDPTQYLIGQDESLFKCNYHSKGKGGLVK